MKDSKDIVRDSIADLLMDNDININDDIDAQTLTFQKTPSTVVSGEIVTLEQSKKKAEKVMNALLKVYLSENFISKSEFAQAKVNLDTMTLGAIMNQMEISQRAIDVLVENIEMGDVNPKLFEALGNLQRTFIDLVKTQNTLIVNASNEYEKLAMDKDVTVPDDSVTTATESGGIKSNSNRDLMRMIRSTINDTKK